MRGLGRGLDALLTADKPSEAGGELKRLALDALRPGKYQPRTRMDQQSLAELAASIREQGIMQPILVRPVAAQGYEIMAGERRWRAARLAGLTEVPAIVREVPDQQALAVSLIENIQREDLNPLEEATGIQRLVLEFGMTHAQAAEAVGRSRSAVSNLLRLLDLAPPVRELLAEGRLDMGHARALLALPVVRQIELAREVAAKQLSVRDVERRVNGTARKSRVGRREDRDISRLEEELSTLLGTKVEVKAGAKHGSGRLIVRYGTLEQLDALLAKLGHGPRE